MREKLEQEVLEIMAILEEGKSRGCKVQVKAAEDELERLRKQWEDL